MKARIMDIITRQSPYYILQSEMEYVVKQYIKDTGNGSVQLNVQKHIGNVNSRLSNAILITELNKLQKAYDVACEYFYKKWN